LLSLKKFSHFINKIIYVVLASFLIFLTYPRRIASLPWKPCILVFYFYFLNSLPLCGVYTEVLLDPVIKIWRISRFSSFSQWQTLYLSSLGWSKCRYCPSCTNNMDKSGLISGDSTLSNRPQPYPNLHTHANTWFYIPTLFLLK